MNNGQLSPVTRILQRIVLAEGGSRLSDAQLLEEFVARRDELAFAALVRRHGPMVWAVCKRILRNEHDAEDAFQATFLILIRRAGSLARPEMVGSWLHGVAHRTALRARARSSRWQLQEILPEALLTAELLPQLAWRELQLVLDQEVDRLPERYRAPVVLCYLEGKTYTQAAQQLGWPAGTVSGRLAKARELLRARLAHRGLLLSAGLLGTILSEHAASADVPSALLDFTVKAATDVAAGGAAASVVSARVAVLTEGVMKAMWVSKLKWATVLLLAAGVLAIGMGSVLDRTLAAGRADDKINAAHKSPAQTADEKGGNPEIRRRAPAPSNRILLWYGGGFASIRPDGKDMKGPSGKPQLNPLIQAYGCRLSPDGRRAAYKGYEQTNGKLDPQFGPPKLYVKGVDQDGPGEVVLEIPFGDPTSWCWSPDGRKLAVSVFVPANHPELLKNPGLLEKTATGAKIWIVDLKTKEKTELKLSPVKTKRKNAPDSGHEIMDWSLDGKWFLTFSYSAESTDSETGRQLNLVKGDGSEVRCLSLPGQNPAFEARFSPDTRKALFTNLKDGSESLFVVDLANGKPLQVLQALNFEHVRACWSPDSKQIACTYTVRQPNPQPNQETESFLVVMDTDGRNELTVWTEKHRVGTVPFASPDWR